MPQAVATPTPLEANLACLVGRNADVAQRLAASAPRGDAAFELTAQGVPCLLLGGVPLCSRHRPLDEAARLAAQVDLVKSAVVVVLGFGAGYHVQVIAERLDRAGIIVVFEPDLSLLRAVLERIDHASWLRRASIVFVTDPEDRGVLAGKLQGAESIIAQGVAFLEHPASRERLGTSGRQFGELFGELVAANKTTLMTTLMRAPDTVRNLLLNIDHYAASPGVADLAGAAAGHPAVVVSAGPSLARNLKLLCDPGVASRAVIVAAQTTLRPLLAAGTPPHFVTALDYHEISARFYEDLSPDLVRATTLVAEPKAHPVVFDSWPGAVRCCANDFLDRVLGETSPPETVLPAGATVAHLALYVARHLGCDPIILIGQDLAFTDGLYYAPGTAIDDVWAPEINPFNTIEMMQWQRIARHRRHLSRRSDAAGRSVYTDAQMLTYLQQFERDFAACERAGVRIIDATEGGLPKQHAQPMPLSEALARHATRPLPGLPVPHSREPGRRQAARERVAHLRGEIELLRETSQQTATLLRRMIEDASDPARMASHFRRLDRYRTLVEEHFSAFEIVNHVNQLGVWKRFRADRRLHMTPDLQGAQRQRAQVERDLENVTWTAEACADLAGSLADADAVLQVKDPGSLTSVLPSASAPRPSAALRGESSLVAAMVAIDPQRNGLGVARSLAVPFGAAKSVLQAVLERLGAVRGLGEILLIAPRGVDVEAMIDTARLEVPVHVERCAGSPFGSRHAAIAAARRWSPTCWRGGISGMSVYDELLCPPEMLAIMRQRGLGAALLVGADWPLLDPALCEAIIERHLERPEQHQLVFTQAPPGLAGCLVGRALMQDLALCNRLSTIGALLVYQPHAPQHDPVARSANVQIDHRVRRSRIRATYDAPRYRRAIDETIVPRLAHRDLSPVEVIDAIEARGATAGEPPRHLVMAICDEDGRSPMPLDVAARLFASAGLNAAGDVAVSLEGGDALLHPEFDAIAARARQAGASGVHVRTKLLAEEPVLRRLLDCGADVISVDVPGAGSREQRRVLDNLGWLAANRTRLSDHPPAAALAIPWIVPRMQRSALTLEEIDSFYDRWQAGLGTPVLDPSPPGDPLLAAVTPPRAARDEERHTMIVRSDGSVQRP